jgi:LmbE family N-acetylglucosaminyl deacetylase
MNAVLFAPHGDDETLFAFSQVIRHRPKVIVVLRSMNEELQGGPTWREREHETELAMAVAKVEWEQWPFYDNAPDWHMIRERIHDYCDFADTVIGPAWEIGGHEQHNEVADIIRRYRSDYIAYTSYVRGHGRTETDNEVMPTPDERLLKDVALACYASQKAWPPTAPWFGDDQREFVL